jgi:hypothetical protein
MFRLKSGQYFRLLIGREVQLFGQFRCALGGIGRAVVPATHFVRRRGRLIVGLAILSGGARRCEREGAGRYQNKQIPVEHKKLLCKAIGLSL